MCNFKTFIRVDLCRNGHQWCCFLFRFRTSKACDCISALQVQLIEVFMIIDEVV